MFSQLACTVCNSIEARTGPLEKKTPSGFIASTSAAGVAAGKTVTSHPREDKRFRMLCLIPKS